MSIILILLMYISLGRNVNKWWFRYNFILKQDQRFKRPKGKGDIYVLITTDLSGLFGNIPKKRIYDADDIKE